MGLLLTNEESNDLICMIKLKHKRNVINTVEYVWTKPFALPAQHSLGFFLDSPRFYPGCIRTADPKLVLHEDIRPGVRQPESNQASPDEHRRGHEDGDGLCDANKRAEDQVPQHCSQLTQSVAEPKASSSGEEKSGGGREEWKCVKVDWITSVFLCACQSSYM